MTRAAAADELFEGADVRRRQTVRVSGRTAPPRRAPPRPPAAPSSGNRASSARMTASTLAGERRLEVRGTQRHVLEAVLLEHPARPAFVHASAPGTKETDARLLHGRAGGRRAFGGQRQRHHQIRLLRLGQAAHQVAAVRELHRPAALPGAVDRAVAVVLRGIERERRTRARHACRPAAGSPPTRDRCRSRRRARCRTPRRPVVDELYGVGLTFRSGAGRAASSSPARRRSGDISGTTRTPICSGRLQPAASYGRSGGPPGYCRRSG